jgi:hypothetical protein
MEVMSVYSQQHSVTNFNLVIASRLRVVVFCDIELAALCEFSDFPAASRKPFCPTASRRLPTPVSRTFGGKRH